ncbi:MAG: hypothetical protein ABIQ93_08830 [Saprospiraceae bacterium]
MAKQNDPSPNQLHQPAHDPTANRENQDRDFPGYPHHPASEDLLSTNSDAERADVNVEDFSRSTWTAARDQAVRQLGEEKRPDLASNDLDDVLPGDYRTTNTAVVDPEAEVTDEDLALLGDPNLDQDGGDDELMENYQGLDDTDLDGEPLNEFAGTISATGSDLDMPNDELESAGTNLDPEEDEENDYFSLGGDKDSLEDDQAGDNF